ncbi:MAG TPA: adenylate/guanylate cyclase domain-containing protein [Actinomycetota bacterium]|jgi:class 3 adenylate cyclase/tetratricopeptide (TPR) repeat protein
MTCPSCGSENPAGQRFCGECGALLAAPVRATTEERKVVTALFSDLVGFTATSEAADPEDVDRMLSAYAAMAKGHIERHGGVVEKFIGDAVVGIFGVPAAHEDDPERAVRAALRIAEDAEELEGVGGAALRLRVGINTGETLVRLGVVPGSGERMLAGDAINTASRIQSIAPEMGVAVGLGTYEATEGVFDYEELEPAELKGKAAAVRVFWAKSPLARLGTDLTRSHDTPFIGREIDLALLEGIFEKAVAANAPQLVTVVGEPGLGKSRIVAELGAYVDAKPDLIAWRQGRCLPYGEGITFWALGEVLKAHAGILESDGPETADAKLQVVLPEGPEREWFRQRLHPLLGIEASSSAEREELFTAWRRFLEHVAERGPTVLVFEDLHWADEAMLAFVEYLADRADGVPLLIVATARPELFEGHPDYAAGIPNANRINLDPLSARETSRLVSALLETSVIPAELQAPILERSGGNPLYAEEYVRLLKDTELLSRRGSGWELQEGAQIPLPGSVQALIAARLDTLSRDRKEIVADAAVVGKVFWVGAVARMGERSEDEVSEVMRELTRKELVRPSRRSSMEGETEYAFWHVLARDVAYEQIPRASRASRHVAAAAWIESKAPARLEDLADVLAYHYTSALELASAAGREDQATELRTPAFRFLTLAGERALELDTATALDAFERALALMSEGDPQRPTALSRFGEAAFHAARYVDADAALEEAIAAFRANGDTLAAARALNARTAVLQRLNAEGVTELRRELLSWLEPLPPSPELLDAMANVAFDLVSTGHPEEAIALLERAMSTATAAGLPIPVRALSYRGGARCVLGDPGGLTDFREAIELGVQAGMGRVTAIIYNNLGVEIRNFQGPAAALDVLEEGLRFSEARGLQDGALAVRTSGLPAMLASGDLEGVLEATAVLEEQAERAGDEFDLMEIRASRASALALQDRPLDAARYLEWQVEASGRTGRADFIVANLTCAATVRIVLGQAEEARALLAAIESTPGLGDSDATAVELPAIVRAALALGEIELAERIAGHLTPRYPYAEHSLVAVGAALAEARGDHGGAASAYSDAAARWEGFGVVIEEAFARLGQGRCLVALSRPSEASEALQRARGIFDRCGMIPALQETDTLLASAIALSS